MRQWFAGFCLLVLYLYEGIRDDVEGGVRIAWNAALLKYGELLL
jgi:hypothetical protein